MAHDFDKLSYGYCKGDYEDAYRRYLDYFEELRPENGILLYPGG